VSLLDGIVRVATLCLVGYPGEAQLHGVVCSGLMPVLVRRKGMCAQVCVEGAWLMRGSWCRLSPEVPRAERVSRFHSP